MKVNQHSFTDKNQLIDFLQLRASESEMNLVFVFADKSYLADNQINQLIQAKYSGIPLIGCTTSGEIMGNDFYEVSIVFNEVKFHKSRIVKKSVTFENVDQSFEVGEKIVESLMDSDLKHIFLLSDGCNINGSRLVEGLNSKMAGKVGISGGLAGDNEKFESTFVAGDKNNFVENCITAIGFYGDSLNINCSSSGGWYPFGIEREVTKCNENIVYEIDGKPALELYKTYLGEKVKDLPASALLFPILMHDESGNELVRTILGIDEKENSLRFAGNLPLGSKIKLMKSTTHNLLEGANDAVSPLMMTDQDLSNGGLVIMVSCVGRKLLLKQRTNEEIESVCNNFPKGVSFTGYYSYGEISSNQGNLSKGSSYKNKEGKLEGEGMAEFYNCSLHNQTMTLTTISEK